MKKTCAVFPFLLILLVSSALAEITITTDQHIYNLGNRIIPSVSIKEASMDGSFRIEIECQKYRMLVFLTPVTLEEGYATALNVPELSVSPSMNGACRLNSQLTNIEGFIVKEKVSQSFF